MAPILVEAVKVPITIRFSGAQVRLPQELQEKIDTYWEELLASGRPYKRGAVFTVTNVEETEEKIEVLVEKTDYAHYLYSQNIDPLGEHSVCIIHTAGPVITKDNYIIFGEMGPQTAQAGKYQLCGGGLDENDLTEEGTLDATHNIAQEFQEEFGVDVTDNKRVESFSQKYFKKGGPTGKMTLIYEVRLKETKQAFLEKYNQFESQLKEQGDLPEFSVLFPFSLNDKKTLQEFLEANKGRMDECMIPLVEFILKEKSRESENFGMADKTKLR